MEFSDIENSNISDNKNLSPDAASSIGNVANFSLDAASSIGAVGKDVAGALGSLASNLCASLIDAVESLG